MVADDEGSREADSDAFQALRFVAAKRLRRGRLTVIDATNVRPRSRRPFIALAAARGLAVAALVFDLPEAVLKSRNRNHRLIPVEVLEEQAASMRDSMNNLAGEGIAPVYRLESEAAVEEAVVRRLPVAFPAGARAASPRPANLARQLELLEP
jgi:predicted kinase